MFTALHHRLDAWGRWPRRIAALGCLLLAALAAVSPGHAQPAGRSNRTSGPSGLAASLPAGDVAVPVAVDAASAAVGIQAGDQIGLLAGPAGTFGTDASDAVALGDHLRVIAVRHPGTGLTSAAGDGSGVVLIVAADREVARQIATHSDRDLLAVLEAPP